MVRQCTLKFYKSFLATVFIGAIVFNVTSLTIKIFMSTVKEQLEFEADKLQELVEARRKEITHHISTIILYYVGFIICILESYRWIVTYVISAVLAVSWFSVVHSNNYYTPYVAFIALAYTVFSFAIPNDEEEDITDQADSLGITFSLLSNNSKWKKLCKKYRKYIYLSLALLLMIIASTFSALFILEVHQTDKDPREVTLISYQHSLETDAKRAFFVLPMVIVVTLCSIPITSCASRIHRLFYPMQLLSSSLFFLIGANSSLVEFICVISILTVVAAFFSRFIRKSASVILVNKIRRDVDLPLNEIQETSHDALLKC